MALKIRPVLFLDGLPHQSLMLLSAGGVVPRGMLGLAGYSHRSPTARTINVIKMRIQKFNHRGHGNTEKSCGIKESTHRLNSAIKIRA